MQRLADSKNINRQEKDKQDKFDAYVKETREQIREIVRQQVEEIFHRTNRKYIKNDI